MDMFDAGRRNPDFSLRRDGSDDPPLLRWPSFAEPTLSLPGRIDVPAAVAGLRHLDASSEPALVFSHLAAVCVPAVCDDIVIDLVENDHGYRIRQPSSATLHSAVPPVAAPGSVDGRPVLGSHTVSVNIYSPEVHASGPGFSGSLVCSWRDGYEPAPADASLIRLMVDHAIALIDRDRLTGRVTELKGQAENLSSTLSRNRQIASAVGVIMALHHVEQAQALDLLIRISDRTDRDLQDVAESVVQTRAVPELRLSDRTS